MFLALDGEHIGYSGADLEAIAQQLADQWIKAKQRWNGGLSSNPYQSRSNRGAEGWRGL
jgi:hypothetical protein